MVNFADGSLLAIWYDTGLTLLGFGAALVLAVWVALSTRRSDSLPLTDLVMVLAAVATLPLALLRVGVEIDLDPGEVDAAGYLSLAGTAVGLLLGGGTLWRRSREGGWLPRVRRAKRPAVGRSAEAADVAPDTHDTTPPADVSPPVIEPAGATVFGGAALSLADISTPNPSAWLHFTSGPMDGQSIPVGPAATSIGRSPDNDIVMGDASVSRHHANITFQDGEFFIEDQETAGGTLVDGMPAIKSPLTSGTVLRMGETEMMFMMASEETVPPEPARSDIGGGGMAETVVAAQSARAMAWLAMTAGPDKGKAYQLNMGDNVVGRDPGCDVVIPDSSVSRRHALVVVRDDEIVAVDLGSRGGTSVDGQRLEGRPLATADVIAVGNTTLVLVEVDGAEHPQPPASASDATIIEQPGTGVSGILVVQAGPDAGKTFAISQGDSVIGRDFGCDVVLTDETVGRRHTLIRRDEERFVAFDLGSRSGTMIGGQTLEGLKLSAGHTISFGNAEMVLMQIGSKEG